jgi:hypothetical protein
MKYINVLLLVGLSVFVVACNATTTGTSSTSPDSHRIWVSATPLSHIIWADGVVIGCPQGYQALINEDGTMTCVPESAPNSHRIWTNISSNSHPIWVNAAPNSHIIWTYGAIFKCPDDYEPIINPDGTMGCIAVSK